MVLWLFATLDCLLTCNLSPFWKTPVCISWPNEFHTHDINVCQLWFYKLYDDLLRKSCHVSTIKQVMCICLLQLGWIVLHEIAFMISILLWLNWFLSPDKTESSIGKYTFTLYCWLDERTSLAHVEWQTIPSSKW